jgi:RNA polymerase sigma-70 factor (ECF subfamily)
MKVCEGLPAASEGVDFMDDGKIVELFWARAETAVAETAQKYAKYCFRISYTILQNSEDAEECVNDTYLHAWNAIPPHRPQKLATFLGKITRNLSLQKYHKNHAQKRGAGQVELALSELEECIPADSGVEQIVEDRLLAESLDAFLRSLRREARMVFVARYWHLYSIQEISKHYDMSESKVKSMLHRTRKKLRSYLESEGLAR